MWLTNEEVANIISEMERGPDRSLAVLGMAMIDARIGDILRTEFHRDDTPFSAKVRNSIFAPERPLGAFGVKINLLYLMGFFTEEAHTDLSTMAKMRNDFGHYTEHKSFESQSMTDRCNGLKLINSHVGPSTSFSTRADGTIWPGDSWGTSCNTDLQLHLVDYELLISTPKGRFIATTKLALCALYMFKFRGLLKPVL